MVSIKLSIATIVLSSCLARAIPQEFHTTATGVGAALVPNPTVYPKITDSHCNDIGDCVSDNVKWGHLAPYVSSAANIVAFNVGDFFQAATVDAQSTAGGRSPQKEVFLPYVFNGPINDGLQRRLQLKLIMNAGQSITWADLATEWSILSKAPDQVFQTTSGIIWTKTQDSKAIGSWTLNVMPI